MVLASQTPRSGLRAIRWTHPPKRRYPLPTETAIARIAAATAAPHCAQYKALWQEAPVRGKEKRTRAKRSDGATNCGTLLQTMIAAADVASGYVAKPIGEGHWERKSLYDLDTLAFGDQVPDERSFKRTERSHLELVAMGLVRSVPWRVDTPKGIRSIAGAKFITDKCWKVLGVLHLVKDERRRRDQARGEAKAAEVQRLIRREVDRAGKVTGGKKQAMPADVAAIAQAHPPPDRGKGGPISAFAASVEALKAHFKE